MQFLWTVWNGYRYAVFDQCGEGKLKIGASVTRTKSIDAPLLDEQVVRLKVLQEGRVLWRFSTAEPKKSKARTIGYPGREVHFPKRPPIEQLHHQQAVSSLHGKKGGKPEQNFAAQAQYSKFWQQSTLQIVPSNFQFVLVLVRKHGRGGSKQCRWQLKRKWAIRSGGRGAKTASSDPRRFVPKRRACRIDAIRQVCIETYIFILRTNVACTHFSLATYTRLVNAMPLCYSGPLANPCGQAII